MGRLNYTLLKVPMLYMWHSLHLITASKLIINPFRTCPSYFRYQQKVPQTASEMWVSLQA